jgi:hypothetical protein
MLDWENGEDVTKEGNTHTPKKSLSDGPGLPFHSMFVAQLARNTILVIKKTS